jgi:hypothetical protein
MADFRPCCTGTAAILEVVASQCCCRMEADATNSRMFVHASRPTASSKTYKPSPIQIRCHMLISILCDRVECSHLRCANVALRIPWGFRSIRAMPVTDVAYLDSFYMATLTKLLRESLRTLATPQHAYSDLPPAPFFICDLGINLSCTVGLDRLSHRIAGVVSYR